MFDMIKNHFKKCGPATKDPNNNLTNNLNHGHAGRGHATHAALVAPVKLELPTVSVTGAPAAASRVADPSAMTVNYGDFSDVYQGFTSDMSGMSQQYFGSYD